MAPAYREQYRKDPNPETTYVIDSRFDNDIMVINKDQFDKKYQKRCNEHGQLVDERGVVVPEQAVGKSARTSPQDEK